MTHQVTAPATQERALALLWGGDARGSRGPARGLTVERIVDAAIEVVERDGPSAMSLRRVAAHLGVGVASLYTYVPGRAELEALMLDAVAVGRILPHERPGSWRDKLEALALDDWQEIRQHPWVLQLGAAEQVPGPNMLRWLDSALRIFEDTSLSEAEKLSVIESVDAYVRGLGLPVRRRQVRGTRRAGSPRRSSSATTRWGTWSTSTGIRRSSERFRREPGRTPVTSSPSVCSGSSTASSNSSTAARDDRVTAAERRSTRDPESGEWGIGR